MEEIVFSAPGKVILHGEHAVVHGKTALAAALNLRTFVRLVVKSGEGVNDGDGGEGTGGPAPELRVNLTDLGFTCGWRIEELESLLPAYKVDRRRPTKTPKKKQKDSGFVPQEDGNFNFANDPSSNTLASLVDLISKKTSELTSKSAVERALLPLLHLYLGICGTHARYRSQRLTAGKIIVASNVPVGAGLGSSASFCTTLAATFLKYCGVTEKKTVNSWAFVGEKLIHGSPSGIDNSVATFGKLILFRDGRITTLDFAPSFNVLLIDTKVPRSTKDLVASVRKRLSATPSIINPIFDSIDGISRSSEQLLRDLSKTQDAETRSEIHEKMGHLFDTNHFLLNALGVGHEALDEARSIAKTIGCLPTKLTGAGGGGCAISLVFEGADEIVIDAVVESLERRNFACWRTSVGDEGVVNHSDIIDEPSVLLRSIMKNAYDFPPKLFADDDDDDDDNPHHDDIPARNGHV